MPSRRLEQITPGLAALTFPNYSGLDCNIYLLGNPQKYWMIDCGLYRSFDDTTSFLRSNNFLPANLQGIYLTHCHADHAGAACLFQRHYGTPIYSSLQDAEPLELGDGSRTLGPLLRDPVEAVKVTPFSSSPMRAEPFELQILPTPGHTRGSVSLYDPKEKMLLSGDTVFLHGSVGRTDFPSSSLADLKLSLQSLSVLDIKALLPGHGGFVLVHGKDHIIQGLRCL